MKGISVLILLLTLTIIGLVAVIVVHIYHSKDYYMEQEVDPAQFGGIKKVTSPAFATFITGDYIDIRNDQGFFASIYPTGSNPFGFRLQPIANTLVYYGTALGLLYAPIEPGSIGAYFIMRPEGDAIILSPDGKILWSTKTTTGKLITFIEDGDIQVYDSSFFVDPSTAKPVWQQTNPEFASTAWKAIA